MTTARAGMTAMGAMNGGVGMIGERDMTKEVILIIKNKIGIVQNVVILTFRSELNVIAVARKRAEAALALNAMTAEAEMSDVVVEMTEEAETTDVAVEMTAEAETTEEVILIKIKIGIVQNVVILTLHSGLNVIAVVRKREEEVLALNAMTAEAETTDVAVEMTAEAETTEEVILIKIKIGIVQNVVILTLHSGLNVIAVARKRVEEVLDLKAMTDADVMTDVAVEITGAEITDVEETTAKIIVAIIQIMIGNVKSVTIQISHSERNVIVVENRKVECVNNHLLDGKAMTEELVKEKSHLNQGLEIGIVLSVENQILQSETTASIVVVQSG
jgi:hypothetical protein